MLVATNPTFGQRLRTLREEAGLTQQQLADRAGMTKGAISRIEADKRSPIWETVISLARALGVPVGAFDVEPPEGEADEPEPPEEPLAPRRRGKK